MEEKIMDEFQQIIMEMFETAKVKWPGITADQFMGVVKEVLKEAEEKNPDSDIAIEKIGIEVDRKINAIRSAK